MSWSGKSCQAVELPLCRNKTGMNRVMNRVRVTSSSLRYKKLEKEVGQVFKETFSVLKKENFRLEVFLISNDKIRNLNREFRGKDEPTNVLSFEEVGEPDFIEVRMGPDKNFKRIGEIYLAPDYISKKGQDFSKLAIHGLLHLFGYKHETKSDTIIMQKLEDRICRVLQL